MACSKLATAASRSSERSSCCVPCGGVEFHEETADDAEQARSAGAEDRVGVVRDDRLQPLRQLGPLHGQHRIGHREVEEPACPQHPQHLAECDIVPHAEDALSGIEGRQRSRAPAAGGSAGSEADIVVVDRAARARDVDRDEGEEHAHDNARGGRQEQQLTGQVRQAASHAAAFRRGSMGSASRPA